MDIYTVKIGKKITRDDGSIALVPWMQFELFDDLFGLDKWLAKDSPGSSGNHKWPYVGEWNRPISDKNVVLYRSDGGPRLARLAYQSWPWKVADMGVAKLDEPFDGETEGIYRVIQVN